MVATSYVGCDHTTLAVVLFSLALSSSALNMSSYNVNHLDIAPRYAGVLMGITNTAGTIPGMIGPYVVGYLTDNEVMWTSLPCVQCYICLFIFFYYSWTSHMVADGRWSCTRDKAEKHDATNRCNKSPHVTCENHCRCGRILSLWSVAWIGPLQLSHHVTHFS